MEIDTVVAKAQKPDKANPELTIRFNSVAALSIEHLTIKSQDTDQILVGFANGKILQLCLDIAWLRAIASDPVTYRPYLDF